MRTGPATAYLLDSHVTPEELVSDLVWEDSLSGMRIEERAIFRHFQSGVAEEEDSRD
jgi:hypothetical protein